jgi:hypothetical protein
LPPFSEVSCQCIRSNARILTVSTPCGRSDFRQLPSRFFPCQDSDLPAFLRFSALSPIG